MREQDQQVYFFFWHRALFIVVLEAHELDHPKDGE